MPKFDVYGMNNARQHTAVSAKQAADLIDVTIEDLNWAIEECGRCDGPLFTAIRHKETNPHFFPQLAELAFNPDDNS